MKHIKTFERYDRGSSDLSDDDLLEIKDLFQEIADKYIITFNGSRVRYGNDMVTSP